MIGERKMRNARYHYRECGLDYVWLMNGFRHHESPRGRTVSIQDVDSLHQAIGMHLCREMHDLSGAEIRYLRQEMLMSQAVLAQLLDVRELTVHRWETGRNHAPRTAEALIRLLYLEQVMSREGKIRASLERIADLEDRMDQHQELLFELSDDEVQNWSLAA